MAQPAAPVNGERETVDSEADEAVDGGGSGTSDDDVAAPNNPRAPTIREARAMYPEPPPFPPDAEFIEWPDINLVMEHVEEVQADEIDKMRMIDGIFLACKNLRLLKPKHRNYPISFRKSFHIERRYPGYYKGLEHFTRGKSRALSIRLMDFQEYAIDLVILHNGSYEEPYKTITSAVVKSFGEAIATIAFNSPTRKAFDQRTDDRIIISDRWDWEGLGNKWMAALTSHVDDFPTETEFFFLASKTGQSCRLDHFEMNFEDLDFNYCLHACVHVAYDLQYLNHILFVLPQVVEGELDPTLFGNYTAKVFRVGMVPQTGNIRLKRQDNPFIITYYTRLHHEIHTDSNKFIGRQYLSQEIPKRYANIFDPQKSTKTKKSVRDIKLEQGRLYDVLNNIVKHTEGPFVTRCEFVGVWNHETDGFDLDDSGCFDMDCFTYLKNVIEHIETFCTAQNLIQAKMFRALRTPVYKARLEQWMPYIIGTIKEVVNKITLIEDCPLDAVEPEELLTLEDFTALKATDLILQILLLGSTDQTDKVFNNWLDWLGLDSSYYQQPNIPVWPFRHLERSNNPTRLVADAPITEIAHRFPQFIFFRISDQIRDILLIAQSINKSKGRRRSLDKRIDNLANLFWELVVKKVASSLEIAPESETIYKDILEATKSKDECVKTVHTAGEFVEEIFFHERTSLDPSWSYIISLKRILEGGKHLGSFQAFLPRALSNMCLKKWRKPLMFWANHFRLYIVVPTFFDEYSEGLESPQYEKSFIRVWRLGVFVYHLDLAINERTKVRFSRLFKAYNEGTQARDLRAMEVYEVLNQIEYERTITDPQKRKFGLHFLSVLAPTIIRLVAQNRNIAGLDRRRGQRVVPIQDSDTDNQSNSDHESDKESSSPRGRRRILSDEDDEENSSQHAATPAALAAPAVFVQPQAPPPSPPAPRRRRGYRRLPSNPLRMVLRGRRSVFPDEEDNSLPPAATPAALAAPAVFVQPQVPPPPPPVPQRRGRYDRLPSGPLRMGLRSQSRTNT